MNEWQPIETAPKDGTRVLVYRIGAPASRTIGIDYWSDRYTRPCWANTRPAEPCTHWMPLPPAPSVSQPQPASDGER